MCSLKVLFCYLLLPANASEISPVASNATPIPIPTIIPMIAISPECSLTYHLNESFIPVVPNFSILIDITSGY